MRKAEQAKERRRKVATFGGSGLIVAIVIVVVVVLALNRSSDSNETLPSASISGTAYTQAMPSTVANTSGITGVTEYNTTVSSNDSNADACIPANVICHLHVTTPVKYALTPPVGGPHNADWMTCGVYDKPVPSEQAVHNLEHGAVWITYRPNLPAARVTQLRNLVKKQKDATLSGKSLDARYVDLTPWASNSLPAPVVISSWGAQLDVDTASDPRLQTFIDKFRVRADQTYEAGAACSPNQDGNGGTPLFS
jgi:hypothetical protein